MVYYNKSTITVTNIIKYGVCFLVPILLLIILYSPYYPFNQNFIGAWRDLHANSMYFTLVGENYFTTWNNLWSGGFPLIASPHSDKYYLFSAPFYMLFKEFTIVNFIILFHVLLAYIAFFKFGTLITKNLNLLMIGSLFYAFSGIFFGRIESGHHMLVYGLAWIPLIYYFFFKIVIYKEATIQNIVLLAIVSAMMYFTGDAYHFIYAYMILGIFFVYYAATKQLSKKTVYYLSIAIVLILLITSIKLLPDMGVSNSILRQDIINPLQGGGSIETDISAFITGTAIDDGGSFHFSQEESTAMIGIVPILLLIIGLIYGKKELTIPTYLAIIFTFIWAAGGKTVLFVIHLLPIVNNFRVPGRIFGAILPIILIIALYGVVIVYTKIKNGESFKVTEEQKTNVLYGIVILGLIKLLELPKQSSISGEMIVPILVIGGFIALIYSGRATFKNIIIFFIGAEIINALLIFNVYSLTIINNLIIISLISILFIALFIYTRINEIKNNNKSVLCGILIIGILLMIIGNLGYIRIVTPSFETSPAIDIIQKIKDYPSENSQLWVFENGWAFQHFDFTYWDIMNNIHPVNLYQAYYLKTMPQLLYTIGNTTYSSADYIVDTLYLENGQQNLPEYTFKVKNISVYKPKHVLPNVFTVRNEQVYPLTIEKFGSDEVIATGQLLPGDIVILKGAYYPGWKANGVDTEPIVNMIGMRIKSNTNKVRFTFEPLDYKTGIILTISGIILMVILLAKRKEIDRYNGKLSEVVVSKGNKKKRKNN